MDDSKPSYYQRNKQKILKGMYRKVRCETCGCEVTFCNWPRHKKSKKHLGIEKEQMSDDDKQLFIQFQNFLKTKAGESPAPAPE